MQIVKNTTILFDPFDPLHPLDNAHAERAQKKAGFELKSAF